MPCSAPSPHYPGHPPCRTSGWSPMPLTADQDAPVVEIGSGVLRGARRFGIEEFLGIPYAAPLVGAARFAPAGADGSAAFSEAEVMDFVPGSRTEVREALARLTEEGVLSRTPRIGTRLELRPSPGPSPGGSTVPSATGSSSRSCDPPARSTPPPSSAPPSAAPSSRSGSATRSSTSTTPASACAPPTGTAARSGDP
ncbi:GntR family transcriptional regulator [Brachybacterium sp. DNPG3]